MRAVIVTGAGRGFCAGADLGGGGGTFDWRDRDGGEAGVPRDGGGQVTLRIFDSLKPVIAAINGPAVGVGITMTLPMDVRIAAAGAKIGFVFARRGIVPEACSSWFLPRLVGISQALEWVETGRVFTAEEALAGGLVRSVHPADEVLGRGAGAGAGDRGERGAGVGGAGAADDVDDAGRRAPDGGPPGRLAGDVRARAVGRRARGRHLVPGEAAGRSSRTASATGCRSCSRGGRSRCSARAPARLRCGTRARLRSAACELLAAVREHRLPVRDEHAVEVELEQRLERRVEALAVEAR